MSCAREEILQHYEQAAGRLLEAMPWFDAFIRYKEAAISALNVKNNRKRARPDPSIERFAPTSKVLIADGIDRLSPAARLVPHNFRRAR